MPEIDEGAIDFMAEYPQARLFYARIVKKAGVEVADEWVKAINHRFVNEHSFDLGTRTKHGISIDNTLYWGNTVRGHSYWSAAHKKVGAVNTPTGGWDA